MGRAPKVSHTAGVLLARPLLFFAVFGLGSILRADGALPRPRAPRLLRLVESNGVPLKGDCYAPQFSTGGDGLFFVRDQNEGRSVWFASPRILPSERYPAWRAVPVWQPAAPFRLSEAVAVPGDDKVFWEVGAGTGQNPATQLGRVEVAKAGVPQTLWSGRERMAHLAPSPDGTSVVFTRYFRDLRGRETPQLWRINSNARSEKPTLILKNARRAFWLDNATLVFERVLGNDTAFYSLNLSSPSVPRFLLRGSGEGAPLGKGVGLMFAARHANAATTALFFLGRDGSGLRAVVGTEGARHPTISRDGTRFAFDAPTPNSPTRALWLAPLDPASETPLNPASLLRPAKMRTSAARCQLEPMPLPPPAPPPNPAPRATPLPTPIAFPTPTPEPAPPSVPKAPSPDADKADMDVSGTLATIAANGKMRVTFWAKNRGTRPWSSDDVRVVVRWIDFDSGMRRRWSFNWMRGTVLPLGQTRFPIDLVAPTKPGRYKVIYGLIRLPSKNATVPPPPYDAPQESWPGEFASTAFAVNVK